MRRGDCAYPSWGDAEISECGTFRYRLQRRWAPVENDKAWLRFVMLNPSTADATLDDPTIRRCIGFAKREGYAAIAVLNLYAYRATSPKALPTCKDAVGPENDVWLRDSLRAAAFWQEPVIAAWGTNAQADRVRRVLDIVPNVDWRCLGTTKDGHPRHPLYVRGDQPLVPFGSCAVGGSHAGRQSGDDGLTDHCGCCSHRRSTGCGGPDCPCSAF